MSKQNIIPERSPDAIVLMAIHVLLKRCPSYRSDHSGRLGPLVEPQALDLYELLS